MHLAREHNADTLNDDAHYADVTKHYEAALQIQLKRAETDIEGRPRSMEIVQLLICLGHVHYEVRSCYCVMALHVFVFSSQHYICRRQYILFAHV